MKRRAASSARSATRTGSRSLTGTQRFHPVRVRSTPLFRDLGILAEFALEGAPEEPSSVAHTHGERDTAEVECERARVRVALLRLDLERAIHDVDEPFIQMGLERQRLHVAFAREADR